jgi:PHP family Zn ribbon phosphoesterase
MVDVSLFYLSGCSLVQALKKGKLMMQSGGCGEYARTKLTLAITGWHCGGDD